MKRLISILLALSLLSGMIFVLPVFSAPYTVGDIDNDGQMSSKDLNILKKYIAGNINVADYRSADINDDDSVTSTDMNLLIRALAGKYIIIQPQEEKVAISEYTVVYPENATRYELYAAEILCDYVEDNYGVALECVADTAVETEYELLIGNTNREESTVKAEILDNQYLIKNVGTKIILHGKDYMIGGAVGALTYDYMAEGNILVENITINDIVVDYAPRKATGIILMIGDGMGYNHIDFAELYMATSESMASYNYDGFIAESFVNQGSVTTYCLSAPKVNGTYDAIVTDSAASATALATGWKTQQKMLGLNGFGSSVLNIRELADSLGYKTGVMSTEPTTGATPSGFTVHHTSRSDADILLAQQTALVENGEIEFLLGQSNDNLLADTKECLDVVSTDSEGFFVMIEEAYIDKACHALGTDYTRNDLAHYMYRFDSAIEYAATFTASRPDTVLIITADHETGNLNKYGALGNTGEHTGQDVPVFAMGYGTEVFNGTTVDNTDIAKFMASVYGTENFGGNIPVNE